MKEDFHKLGQRVACKSKKRRGKDTKNRNMKGKQSKESKLKKEYRS